MTRGWRDAEGNRDAAVTRDWTNAEERRMGIGHTLRERSEGNLRGKNSDLKTSVLIRITSSIIYSDSPSYSPSESSERSTYDPILVLRTPLERHHDLLVRDPVPFLVEIRMLVVVEEDLGILIGKTEAVCATRGRSRHLVHKLF